MGVSSSRLPLWFRLNFRDFRDSVAYFRRSGSLQKCSRGGKLEVLDTPTSKKCDSDRHSFHLDSFRTNYSKVQPFDNSSSEDVGNMSITPVAPMMSGKFSISDKNGKWIEPIKKSNTVEIVETSGSPKAAGRQFTIFTENYFKRKKTATGDSLASPIVCRDIKSPKVFKYKNDVESPEKVVASNHSSRSIVSMDSINNSPMGSKKWCKLCNYCHITFHSRAEYAEHVTVSLFPFRSSP